MRAGLAAATLLLIAGAAAAQAPVQGKARHTSDWPCVAIKVPEISLAAVWSGPPLDGIQPAQWRDDAETSALVARLAARRTPQAEAEQAVADFAKAAGPERKNRLLALYAGLFSALAQERAQVVAGLDRFGKRQKELADQVRAETAAMRALQDKPDADPKQLEDTVNRLTWNMRIFEDKRKSVSFVCETPVLIEQRLFALGRAVMAQLE